mmetsp:Transcript_49801/g.161033  ORF Transcript_49801/g.161033 Transcript_49801/m.161033 type:complete len:818 (-) Transcript_49801:179-2632(-)
MGAAATSRASQHQREEAGRKKPFKVTAAPTSNTDGFATIADLDDADLTGPPFSAPGPPPLPDLGLGRLAANLRATVTGGFGSGGGGGGGGGGDGVGRLGGYAVQEDLVAVSSSSAPTTPPRTSLGAGADGGGGGGGAPWRSPGTSLLASLSQVVEAAAAPLQGLRLGGGGFGGGGSGGGGGQVLSGSAPSAPSRLPGSRSVSALPQVPDEVVTAVAALSASTLALANAKGQVMVMDWQACALVASWTASERQVTVLEPIGDARHLFTGSATGEIVLWGAAGERVAAYWGHTQEVRSISFFVRPTDGARRMVSGSRDCTMRLWDVDQASCLHSVLILRNVVTKVRSFVGQAAVSVLGSCCCIQTSEDLRLRLWAVGGGHGEERLEVKHEVHAGREQLVALDVAPEGRLAAVGSKGFERASCEVSVWDMQSMEKLTSAHEFDNTIEALRFLQRGGSGGGITSLELVAVSCDASMKCFSLPSLAPLWVASSCTHSPFTSLDVACGLGGEAVLYAATTEPEVFVWACPQQQQQHAPNEPPLLLGKSEVVRGGMQTNDAGNGGASLEQRFPATRLSVVADRLVTPSTGFDSAPFSSSSAALAVALARVQEEATTYQTQRRRARLAAGAAGVAVNGRLTGLSPLARARDGASEEEVRAVFSQIDTDGDGQIDVEELRAYLGDFIGYGEQEIAHFAATATASSSSSAPPGASSAPAVAGAAGAAAAAAISFEAFQWHFGQLSAMRISNRNQESFLRKPGSIGGQQFCLEDCTNCSVRVCDVLDQTFVDQCSGCRVLLGPSSSSTFVRDCSDCARAPAFGSRLVR